MTYTLGVDLGTTFTAAATARGGRAELVRLGSQEAVIPSAVFIKDDGDVLFGEAAVRRGREDPTRLASQFKRRVGDPAPILIGGAETTPSDLTAKLLRHVVDVVTEREGEAPARTVVTHPANWGDYKRGVFADALELAGVEADLLTEPEAAAIAYTTRGRIDVGDVVAVYDLGGGTFDVALLRRTETGFRVLGEPQGVELLGGIDFDSAIAQWAMAEVGIDPDDLAGDTAAERLAAAAIAQEAEAAKIALSSDTDTVIELVANGETHRVRLTRTEFEAMVTPSIEISVAAVRRALKNAGLEAEQVDRVLLVGGSSRIPAIGGMVSNAFGRPVAVDADPKAAICTGAALWADQTQAADNARPPVLPPPTERPSASVPVVAPPPPPPAFPTDDSATSVFPAAQQPPASPIAPSPVVATPSPGPTAHRAVAGSAVPPEKSKTGPIAAVAVLVALIVAGIAFAVTSGSDDPEVAAADDTTTTSTTEDLDSTTSSTEQIGGGETPGNDAATLANDAFDAIDFANKTYDIDCFETTTRVDLVDGQSFGAQDAGGINVFLDETLRDDFDSDGQNEVITIFGCATGANGSAVEAIIFEAENGQVVRSGNILIAERGNIVRDGLEFIQTAPIIQDDEPSCCPSQFSEDRFRVIETGFGATFEFVSSRTIAAEDF